MNILPIALSKALRWISQSIWLLTKSSWTCLISRTSAYRYKPFRNIFIFQNEKNQLISNLVEEVHPMVEQYQKEQHSQYHIILYRNHWKSREKTFSISYRNRLANGTPICPHPPVTKYPKNCYSRNHFKFSKTLTCN